MGKRRETKKVQTNRAPRRVGYGRRLFRGADTEYSVCAFSIQVGFYDSYPPTRSVGFSL